MITTTRTSPRTTMTEPDDKPAWLKPGYVFRREVDGCYGCRFQRLGGMTFLGWCGWFEAHGRERKAITNVVVDVGCKFWEGGRHGQVERVSGGVDRAGER